MAANQTALMEFAVAAATPPARALRMQAFANLQRTHSTSVVQTNCLPLAHSGWRRTKKLRRRIANRATHVQRYWFSINSTQTRRSLARRGAFSAESLP